MVKIDNKIMKHSENKSKPLLSICITSYNRVDELYRCLKSIHNIKKNLIEIIVSEDCSPRQYEISQIAIKFSNETEYNFNYSSNNINLGYDQNFVKLLNMSSGKYLLFVTDDDAIVEGSIDLLIAQLQKIDCAVAFTPYISVDTNRVHRKYSSTFSINCGIESVSKFLYSSILLSGLIFKKDKLPLNYPLELKNLIYSQLYVFSVLLYKFGGYYIDVPTIKYIGDGENSFGTNESGDKDPLLVDRKSVYSNLEYHKRLIKLIKIFDLENNANLMKFFSKEYSLKCFTGMYIARLAGIKELIIYWAMLKNLGLKLSLIPGIYFLSLLLIGPTFSKLLFSVPKICLYKLRDCKDPI